MTDYATIEDVRLTPVQAPLARPMRTASGTLPGAALGIVDVRTSSGIVGTSYIFAYTPRTLRALAALTADIKDVFVGKAADPAARFADAQATFRLLGIQGLLGMVLSGIDMALWDAWGKAEDKPVCGLLGVEPVPLKAYDSYGFVADGEDAALLEESLAKGFKAIKIKLGIGSVEDDIASVRHVRSVVGPEMLLMVDYNQSLAPAEALENIERLQDYDIAWVEEPVPAEDLAGHATVRAGSSVPVQTGENWWFPTGARLAIDAGASDLIMPDVMKIGGFTGWHAVAAMAKKAGLPVSSHAFVEASAHALAATPRAHWLEYLDKARPLLVEGYDVVDGNVTARGPGLGIVWDADKVAAYAA